MKIVHCNTVTDRGGAADVAVNLCKSLVSEGHEVVLAYGRGSMHDVQSYNIENDMESNKYALYCRILDNDGFAAHKPTRRLIKYLDSLQPDVFHLHNAHGYYLDIVELFGYLRDRDIPVVWTMHDYWPVTGHCAFFSMGNCEKWKSGQCSDCILKQRYPKSLLKDSSKKNYNKKKEIIESYSKVYAVAPSVYMGNQLRLSPIRFPHLTCIPNGVDTDTFQYTDSDLRKQYHLEGKKVILAVANGWGERKGYYDFLKLATMIQKSYSIVMIGFITIPKNLPSNIVPILRTNKKELIKWYSMADVYVSLSKDETFGLTSVEALACGTPIVQYDVATSREIINLSCGRVCQDIIQVKAALEEIIDLGDLSKQCIERAEFFSLKAMCSNYSKLYEKCVTTKEYR